MDKKFLKRLISCVTLAAFLFAKVPVSFAQSLSAVGMMPQPGTTVSLTPNFMPAELKGMVMHAEDPFKFDFLIYRGAAQVTSEQKQDEYTKLIKYFLAALAVPDTDQWVNLSPYEKDRIIPDGFGLTEMGRDLLAQDYLLKQIAASLTNPDGDLGKKFWDGVYAKAQEKFGTTDIPTDTFNKVWITPDKALIYEKDKTVYVLENHLKVMLESDYVAMSHQKDMAESPAPAGDKAMKENGTSAASSEDDEAVKISKQVMREIIIPAIEKEVNEGKNFAPLRQMYSGMLLATWYKRALKETVLGQLYADKGKVKGVDQKDPKTNQEIWEQYVTAFKKGVFSMIKEDADRYSGEMIPRKYFSGGTVNGYPVPGVMQQADAAQAQADFSQDAPGLEAVTVRLEQSNAIRRDVTTHNTEQDISSKRPGQGLLRGERLQARSWNNILDYLNQGMTDGSIRLKRLYVDIDNTLISPMGWQDSEGQKDYLIEKLTRTFHSSAKAREIVYGLYGPIEERKIRHGAYEAPAQLDPQRLKRLQASGVDVIALTARPGTEPMQMRVKAFLKVTGISVDRLLFSGGTGSAKVAVLMGELSRDGLSSDEVVFVDDKRVNTDEMAANDVATIRVAPRFSNYEDIGFYQYIQWAKDAQVSGRSGLVFEYLMNAYDQALEARRRAFVVDLSHQMLTGQDLIEFEEAIHQQAKFMQENQLEYTDFVRTEISSLREGTPDFAQDAAQGKISADRLLDEKAWSEAEKEMFSAAVQSTIEKVLGTVSVAAQDKERRHQQGRAYDAIAFLTSGRLPIALSKLLQEMFGLNAEIRLISGLGSRKAVDTDIDMGPDQNTAANHGRILLLGIPMAEVSSFALDDLTARSILKQGDVELIRQRLIRMIAADVFLSGEIKAEARKGGIDLNAASLDMQIRRDGNGVVLPVSQQPLDQITIDGLVPVILYIQPAADLALFRVNQ